MNEATPRPSWNRETNPVTPTVVTFSGGDSANAPAFTRVTNSITPTIVTFAPITELILTLTVHPQSDRKRLPLLAAMLIHQVSQLEQQLGGQGVIFDHSGTREEPNRLILRLLPKLVDVAANERFRLLCQQLTLLADEARRQLIAEPEGNIVDQIQLLHNDDAWKQQKIQQDRWEPFAGLTVEGI